MSGASLPPPADRHPPKGDVAPPSADYADTTTRQTSHTMSDPAATAGPTTDGPTADGTTADGTTADGSTAGGTTADGTTAGGTTADGTTADGSFQDIDPTGGRRRTKRADMMTITDVARHAGVAVSTVSYVLSGKRAISAVTRQRVMASIRALGYHPHASARALASRRANVIALVLPLRTGIHLPVLMQFATAVVTTARQVDHDVLLVTADEGTNGLSRIAASAMVDGIVVMDVEMHDPRVPLLRRLERPSVLIGFPADAAGLTCVDLDFYRAGAACVHHLAALGHRRIALLGAPGVVYERGTGFAQRTMAGFTETAAGLGVAALAQPCEENYSAIRDNLVALLREHPDLSALVVHNEAAVGHVLAILAELDRQVPRDMSVVAICPDELAERSSPRLTSVLIPAEEIGQQAVALLMRKVEHEIVPDATLLDPRLTIRDSTAPAPIPR